MAFDISKIKSRLNSLSNANNKSNLVWKPKPGKQVVRIVPYKFNPDQYSFIELKFHYNLNNKTYLSPDSFGRPDPIVEWSNRLKKGSKDEWKLGKKMEPKLRTYAPIIVRGEEAEGIRFWGFGKTVYEELLKVIADPDFGDISDLQTGRDITVEFKEAVESGKSFPETTIRVKPNPSVALSEAQKDLLEYQSDILELFPEYSYDELKEIMNAWLSPEGTPNDEHAEPATTTESPANSAESSKDNTSSAEAAFDTLFGKTK